MYNRIRKVFKVVMLKSTCTKLHLSIYKATLLHLIEVHFLNVPYTKLIWKVRFYEDKIRHLFIFNSSFFPLFFKLYWCLLRFISFVKLCHILIKFNKIPNSIMLVERKNSRFPTINSLQQNNYYSVNLSCTSFINNSLNTIWQISFFTFY